MIRMAVLQRQLQLSLDLAAECARLMTLLPGPAETAALCRDHLAHAEALTRLIGEGCPSCTAGSDLPVHVAPAPSLEHLTALVRVARDTARQACLTASDPGEIDLLAMITAALAGHEVVLAGAGFQEGLQ